MYYAMRASAPSLHRESTDSLIQLHIRLYSWAVTQLYIMLVLCVLYSLLFIYVLWHPINIGIL